MKKLDAEFFSHYIHIIYIINTLYTHYIHIIYPLFIYIFFMRSSHHPGAIRRDDFFNVQIHEHSKFIAFYFLKLF